MLEKTDDIDLFLTLHPNRWSSCWIYVNGKNFELAITHVFGNPYSDFISALSRLIDGHKEVSFFWYREPGGERIEIKRIKDQHMINITVDRFYESFGEEIKDFEKTVDFEIKQKAFLCIAYLQLKKIELLLKDKTYAKERGREFPFTEFKKFELKAKEYLELQSKSTPITL